MKISKIHLLSVSLALLAPWAHAQTITQVILGQSAMREQTSTSDPVLMSGAPFYFGTAIKGTGIESIAAPTLTLANPGSVNTNYSFSNPTGHNGGALGYNSSTESWNYGAPDFFENVNFATGGQRNTAFPFGAYAIGIPVTTQPATTINLNFTGVGFPALTVPKVTLTGGTWSGGKYVIDVSQTLTITTNSFATFGGGGGGNWEDSVLTSELANGVGAMIVNENRFYSDNPSAPNFVTLTVNPNTLTAGQDYFGYMEFTGIVDFSTELAGSLSGAYVALETHYTISAIPEPSTYAIFAAVGVLGVACWRCRRASRPASRAAR